ncbi:c-type cytochrome [Mucilaginibacter paludis]|uniref:Cytochrome c class I n=1 Tax=Mucilaginibacter paludis DSM 18603 TaxID=714943 RepID=H1Y592_9SPHI|nr:cytochrome c [Mucilaginibacter paludis]EHQ28903.1 cytochrome c class I [Mucilaginibacter paludis DSM 18603]
MISNVIQLKYRKSYIVILAGFTLIGLTAFNSGVFSKREYLSLRDTIRHTPRFGFGRIATEAEIAKWDIDVRPDGKGLPAGEGDAAKGKAIYALKCIACHGATGEEVPGVKLPAPALVSDTSAKSRPKTIGNYWPYATTLFDYMRRTMPYNLPGSLTDNEVYSLTAYLLSANKIIKPETVMNAQTLPRIVMPARKLFVTDDRKGGPEIK